MVLCSDPSHQTYGPFFDSHLKEAISMDYPPVAFIATALRTG